MATLFDEKYYYAAEERTTPISIEEFVEFGLAPEDYVIGFRKGDVKFQAEVDRILDEMEKDGTMKQIQANWFAE